jgi:hypothetical protein
MKLGSKQKIQVEKPFGSLAMGRLKRKWEFNIQQTLRVGSGWS